MTSLVRLRPIARGGLAALIAITLTSVASALAASPTDWRSAARVSTVQPGGVRLIVGGQLTSQVTSSAPPGADLRALTVEKASDGYAAHIFFTGTFQQVDSYAGQPISHAIFISLRPPAGDELQVQLLPGGQGKIQRVQSGKLTDVGTASPTVEGDHVTFPIPASLSPKPDWEVQGHVIMLRPNGSGFHKHTKPALIGSLTGEVGAKMAFPSSGVVMENGKYLYWKHADMPPEARPVSFNVERQSGKLIAVLTLAAPFKPVPSINGQPVDDQGAQFVFFETPESTGGYVLFWLALEGRAVVVDLRDQQNPKQLGETKPTISGNQVRFDLSLIPLPASLKSPKAQKGVGSLFLEAAAQETPSLKVADSTLSVGHNGNGIVMPGVTTQTALLTPALAAITPATSGIPWTVLVIAGAVAISLVVIFAVTRRRGGATSIQTVPASSGIGNATRLPPFDGLTTASELQQVNRAFADADVAALPGTIPSAAEVPPPIEINMSGAGTLAPTLPWPGTTPPPLQSTQSSPAVAQPPHSDEFDPFGIFSQTAEAGSAPTVEPPQPTGPPMHDVTGDIKFPTIDVFTPLDVVRDIRTVPPTTAGGQTGTHAPDQGATPTNPPVPTHAFNDFHRAASEWSGHTPWKVDDASGPGELDALMHSEGATGTLPPQTPPPIGLGQQAPPSVVAPPTLSTPPPVLTPPATTPSAVTPSTIATPAGTTGIAFMITEVPQLQATFNDGQTRLGDEVNAQLKAYADFLVTYTQKWSSAVEHLEAYMTGYATLVPGMTEIWAQHGNREWANHIASWIDTAINDIQLGIGAYGIAKGLWTIAVAETAGVPKFVIGLPPKPVLPVAAEIEGGATAYRPTTTLAEVRPPAVAEAPYKPTTTIGEIKPPASIMEQPYSPTGTMSGVKPPAPGPEVTLPGTDPEIARTTAFVKRLPGVTDVNAHGGKAGVGVQIAPKIAASGGQAAVDSRWVTLTKDQVIAALEHGGYKGGKIRLLSCWAGSGPSCIAQQLADALGVQVIAPDGIIWIWNDGTFTIGPAAITDIGSWRIFSPGATVSAPFTP